MRMTDSGCRKKREWKDGRRTDKTGFIDGSFASGRATNGRQHLGVSRDE